MVIAILTFLALWLGYKFNAPRLERNWGVNIHHQPNAENGAVKPLNYRLAQLAQLGIIMTIQMLFGAIMGVVYGPLQMIWIVCGTIILSATLNYYGGIYAITHQGHTLNHILKDKYPRFHKISGCILLLILTFGVAGTFSILYHIDYLVHNHSPIIYFFFASMVVIAVCTQRVFQIFCIIFAVVVLLVSFYFMMYTAGEFQFASLSLDLSQYPELKFTYPLLFFTVSAGIMSGIDGLKGALLAPSIKNEKMAKGIYIGAAFAQAGLIVLWAMILLAWNPEFAWLNKAMQRIINPYELVQTHILNHFDSVSAFILYLTSCVLCIGTGATLLRLTGILAKEMNVDKDVAHDFVPLGIGFLAFGLYFISAFKVETISALMMLLNVFIRFSSLGMSCFDLLNTLVAIYIFVLLILYMRSQQKRYVHYIYICFVLGGICIAYVINILWHAPFWLGTVLGLLITLLSIGGWYYYPQWKEKHQK